MKQSLKRRNEKTAYTFQHNHTPTQVSGIARGVLGETSVATRDAHGEPIMTGMEAIRGTQNDCKCSCVTNIVV